ncbi:MAG: hypothetical protein OEY14_17300, partial [Myxococcales bacterium]|nr:hypothetical protein [Myxococcales bacterium]
MRKTSSGWTLRGLMVVASACGALGACTGHTLGENEPGADTWLENGSIAVEPVGEISFVLRKEQLLADDGRTVLGERKTLFAIPPEGPAASIAADLSEHEDLRILFPEGALMVMGEQGGVDILRTYDPETYAPIDVVSTSARYHGTRMSPSRRWVAVADNAQAAKPIHLIEAGSLQILEIPHDGEWLEAMWLHGSDTLVAIVFYEIDQPTAYARVMIWDLPSVKAGGFATDADGTWSLKLRDLRIDGVSRDLAFSFTWVGIAGDDSLVVFPVRQYDPALAAWGYALRVLDLDAGTLRSVGDAQGPVGFTPDSSTIVSYHYVDDGMGGTSPELLLIDAATLETTPMAIPWDGLPQYFVSHEGNYVVAA